MGRDQTRIRSDGLNVSQTRDFGKILRSDKAADSTTNFEPAVTFKIV